MTGVPYDTISTNSVNRESVFTRCCLCIPIRIGCFILGYMNLVFNTFHTLALLTLTTYIGVTTHGFDHFDSNKPHVITNPQLPDYESIERPFLNQVGVLLVVVLCANVAWLLINIACLVGLHKRNPGPIRVYIAFASIRLLLALTGFVYLVMTSSASVHTVVVHSLDLGLASYFILVYYIHAGQLERERVQNIQSHIQSNIQGFTNDIAFICPTKVEKGAIIA